MVDFKVVMDNEVKLRSAVEFLKMIFYFGLRSVVLVTLCMLQAVENNHS
jgi:hypothetical protein